MFLRAPRSPGGVVVGSEQDRALKSISWGFRLRATFLDMGSNPHGDVVR